MYTHRLNPPKQTKTCTSVIQTLMLTCFQVFVKFEFERYQKLKLTINREYNLRKIYLTKDAHLYLHWCIEYTTKTVTSLKPIYQTTANYYQFALLGKHFSDVN